MKRTWRIPALILLPLLVVAGLVIEARDDDHRRRPGPGWRS